MSKVKVLGSANNLLYLFIFFGAKENERRVVKTHHYRKAPVSFGPTDYFALLKAAGILKTRYAQTV